jgi:hypothetical protein
MPPGANDRIETDRDQSQQDNDPDQPPNALAEDI